MNYYLKYYSSFEKNENKIKATYIWTGGNNELRSKTRTLYLNKDKNVVIPNWNYDGSSTNQSTTEKSDIIIKPVRIFKDPFSKNNNILVLCDTYNLDSDEPHVTNTRYNCNMIMEKVKEEEPWFGLEQEYILYESNGETPIGWSNKIPVKQGQYYCSVGTNNSIGRHISDSHYNACLYAGINISGSNAEVMPGQWEYQIGPCTGVSAGDELIASRYILHRICEDFNVVASFEPKPFPDWNGSGCHTNYSYKKTRQENGYVEILKAIEKLGLKHSEHIEVYGDNKNRLIGKHETSSYETFTYGVSNRNSSVRIPADTYKNKCGYLEDRRPASDCDPYIVTSMLVKTTLL